LKVAEAIARLDSSAGIITNANDVIFRNPSSFQLFEQWERQFKIKIVENTATSHDTAKTASEVLQLKEISLPLDLCEDFIEKRYRLHIEGLGSLLVLDRFYRLKLGGRGCRIWVNQSWSYAFSLG